MEPMEWSDDALWAASSDDDAILEAALHLIESADPPETPDACGALEVRVSLGSSGNMMDTTSAPRPRRGRPKTSGTSSQRRNRTKEAIEQLRPLVHKLEIQLCALKRRRDELDGSRDGKEEERKSRRCDAWKSMAERQLVQRKRVETEKQTLLQILEEQTATIRKLQRVFTQHENQVRARPPLGPTMSMLWCTSPASSEVLHSLTQALGNMHLHTDTVLADDRFASPESSIIEVKAKPELGIGTLAVQLMDTRVVPFSLERTAQATWQNLLNRANQGDTPSSTDAVQSQFITYVPGFDGQVEAAMALRRVVEPDRVVMVRCSVFEYKRTGGTTEEGATPASMTLHHFLWTAVSRPRDAICADECQIQTCFMSVPNLSDRDRQRAAAITALCADVSKWFNDDAHDEVDNILLSNSDVPREPVRV